MKCMQKLLIFIVLILSINILEARKSNLHTRRPKFENKGLNNMSEGRPSNAPNFTSRFFKFGQEQRFNYDPEKRVDYFSLPMAKYFSRFAKFGYCEVEDIESYQGVCPSILAGAAWGINRIEDIVKIMINEKYKKIVFSCAGEKRLWKLPENLLNSLFVDFEGTNSKIKVLKYFKDIQDDPFTRKTIDTDLVELSKYYPDYQYIFVGHSLGGAICNLLAHGAVKSKIIKKSDDSPVLITYGQPITGNAAFVKDSKKQIPLIFRVVRNEDAVPTYPRNNAGPDDYINPSVYPKDIGDFYTIDTNAKKFTYCSKEKGMDAMANQNECQLNTTYETYNNKFYLKDNLSDIDPLTEYNKVVFGVKKLYNQK